MVGVESKREAWMVSGGAVKRKVGRSYVLLRQSNGADDLIRELQKNNRGRATVGTRYKLASLWLRQTQSLQLTHPPIPHRE
jgi:hypothetical protein